MMEKAPEDTILLTIRRRIMRLHGVCFFFIVTGIAVNVQTVNAAVSGTVSNLAGKPIAGAIVSLKEQGTRDTTDLNGSFSLVTTDATVSPSARLQRTTITVQGNIINFSLSGPSPVTIELFNAQGALLKKASLPNVQTGCFRFTIAENSFAADLMVIRVSVGRTMTTFRRLWLQSGSRAVNSSPERSIPVRGALAKTKAVHDTLTVTAAHYAAKATAITSYDTTVAITLDTADAGVVTVHLDRARQEMAGFGINNTWAPAMTDGAADALFDTIKGIGLSILRIGMGSDGEPMNGESCWSDIKKAKARGCTYIIGTLWSPPGSYKTGSNPARMKAEYYEVWAGTIAAFPAKVKLGAGADLYAMSLQNEPDFTSPDYPTMLFTDAEYTAFVKVAGPKLRSLNPPVKVLGPETSEWLRLWTDESAPGSADPLNGSYDYCHALSADADAWARIDIVGTHQYETQAAEPWPGDVPQTKPVWMTEMSGIRGWPEAGPSKDISNGVAVAGWIHDAVVNGRASAWCWWWYNSQSDINEGLLLNGQDTKRHYTLGNFSRFVRPGFVRVDITGNISADVLLSAYKDAGGALVIVAVNKGDAPAAASISIAGGKAPNSLTPWVTSASDNLKSGDAITVSGGTFTAQLDAKTVTTFAGR